MSESLMQTSEVRDLLTKVSGLGSDGGDARVKRIVNRVVGDLLLLKQHGSTQYRADCRRGQGREDRDRMDIALV